MELPAVGFKVVDAAWKQACAKGDMNGAKLSVEELAGNVGELDLRYGKLDALFGQVAPEGRKGGVAVFTCGEANENGGERREITGLNIAEQSVLLNFSGDLRDRYRPCSLYCVPARKGGKS